MDTHDGDQQTSVNNCRAGVPKRYVLTFLGSLGFFCVYSLRVNLNVALVAMVRGPPPLLLRVDAPTNVTTPAGRAPSSEVKGEFDWDSNVQGIVLGSFYYGYVLTQIPGGVLAERWGAKWVFGLGILLTAVLSLLTPLAARWSVWALILTRACEGLGEGVTFPAMHSLIGRWVPQQERSLLSTLVYSGSYVGTVASFALSGVLCDSRFLGGWPAAFYVFGALGCVWFVLWIAFAYDSPEDHPSISKEELLHIRLGQEDVQSHSRSPVPWKKIFTSVPVWGLVVTHFGNNWGFYTVLTDLPTYLSNVLHFDLEKNGTVSAVPNLIEVAVAVFSSMVADKLLASGRLRTTTIRKIMNSIAFFVPAACLLPLPFLGCGSASVIVVLLSSVVSLNGFVYSGFNVTHLDMSPEFAGTLMGITNCIANIPGFLAPSFVAWMIQDGNSQENWGKVFIATSAIFFVSGLVFNVFCTAELQPWGSNERPSGDDVTVATGSSSDSNATE